MEAGRAVAILFHHGEDNPERDRLGKRNAKRAPAAGRARTSVEPAGEAGHAIAARMRLSVQTLRSRGVVVAAGEHHASREPRSAPTGGCRSENTRTATRRGRC